MAFDVFISYSRKDLTAATELAERLEAEGLTIWIDRHSIGGAKTWAAEITAAIRDCGTLILLISEHAVTSTNVMKEVALAAKIHKPILPIVLREAPLPDSIEYHLAGIHHLYYSDSPSILRAVKGHAAISLPAKVKDTRKTLLVLPFDDLSPGKNNGWFADGLAAELISTLSQIKSLRVIDRATSMTFKHTRRRALERASELSVGYILDGAVRKANKQIKIDIDLTDLGARENLWHYTQKGTFADIFDFQEQVAQKVVTGLELTLSRDEAERLRDYGTLNSTAFEEYLRARHYFLSWSKEGMKEALGLTPNIIASDPTFIRPYLLEAHALLSLYRLWERKKLYLKRIDELFESVERIRPGLVEPYYKIILYILENRFEDAEALALSWVRDAPFEYMSHLYLGFFYFNVGRIQSAVPEYETSLYLHRENSAHPDYRLTCWNLIEALDWLGREEDRRRYAFLALPHFARALAENPTNQFSRAQLATLELYNAEKEKALETIAPLVTASDVDALSLYTAAVFFMHVNDFEAALDLLERAIASSFSHLEFIERDPNLNPLRDTPRFRAAVDSLRLAIEAVNSADAALETAAS